MKERDALFLLLLLVVAARSSSATVEPPRVPGSTTVERWLTTGVYWWCTAPNEAEPLVAWFRDNAASVRLVKMLGTDGGNCAVVLFEVRERVVWPLSGTPEEAPNGVDTTLEDLRGETKLGAFFRRMAEKTLEHLKRVDEAVQQWLQQHLPTPPAWP